MSKLLKFTSVWQRQVSFPRCKINHSRAASRSGVMRQQGAQMEPDVDVETRRS